MLNGNNGARRPLRVELVGPAGVGKSSLVAALLRGGKTASGTIWGLPVLPLLGNGLQLVPTFAGLWCHSGAPLWDEARHMVRLRTLRRAFRRNGAGSDGILLLDEGPIFALVWLRGFGHETMRSPASERWWRSALTEWARGVDAVVILEAPDSTLAWRIRERPTEHEVKGFSDGEISAWMARFRAARDWVLAELAARGGPIVLRIGTGQEPPERIAERLLTALAEGPHVN